MRAHPVIGADLVGRMDAVAHLAPAIRAEHERWDGTGYPDGLARDAIPTSSQIVFVCDALHAMTSNRPYRTAMSYRTAITQLHLNAGTQFAPAVVDATPLTVGSIHPAEFRPSKRAARPDRRLSVPGPAEAGVREDPQARL
jgi:HD-GYP domain-containing protein (c-di-GMP phosphodiesterase class II)